MIGADKYAKDEDLYECYKKEKIDIVEYGEDYCRFLNPIVEEGRSAPSDDSSEGSSETCINNDDVADSYGDTCSSYYDGSPEGCGGYDTEEFISAEACCACGGGTIIEGVYDPYKACLDSYTKLEDISKKYTCDILNATYDQIDFREYCWPISCQSDNSVGDTDGDTCSSYYDNYPSGCGYYDTDEFIAAEACCSCGGGSQTGEI